MPILGVSAPMNPFGAFVIALASVWGAWAIVRALTGKEYLAAECRVWPTSMRNLDLVYGSPEMIWSELVNEQLRLFYGWAYGNSDSFHSSAVLPDSQTAFTRGAYGMAAALLGKRSFRFGGLLGVDLVFSPEQLVLDVENLGYLRHTVEDLNFSEEAFCMDSIFNVGPSGTFLMEDSTLTGYRDVLWEPRLFSHDSVGVWHANGNVTVQQRAREEVRNLISKHEFRLPDDKLKEIDKLFKAAEADLLGF
jgi:trimethylamine---corrinoid protein Co-methyltransferase